MSSCGSVQQWLVLVLVSKLHFQGASCFMDMGSILHPGHSHHTQAQRSATHYKPAAEPNPAAVTTHTNGKAESLPKLQKLIGLSLVLLDAARCALWSRVAQHPHTARLSVGWMQSTCGIQQQVGLHTCCTQAKQQSWEHPNNSVLLFHSCGLPSPICLRACVPVCDAVAAPCPQQAHAEGWLHQKLAHHYTHTRTHRTAAVW